MKKFLLFTFLTFSYTMLLKAQETRLQCGTDPTPSKWTEAYLSNRSAYQKTDEILYVPVTVHAVGTDAGDGFIELKAILDAFCTLNEDFESANVKFYIQGNIKYIKNTRFYNHATTSSGKQLASQYKVGNTINTFIVDNAAGTAGYSGNINSDFVVMDKEELEIGNHTWGHEVGHALALYHTFWGWEGYTHDYSLNAPSTVTNNRSVERVDGSNCKVSGDGLCDTSPDYLKDRWPCNNQGLSDILQKDPTGTTFRSDARNIMSYASDACVERFSSEQIQVMRSNLTSDKRFFISPIAPLPDIDTVKVALSSPATGATVDFSNVVLEWEAVPGATDYLVEVSIYPNFIITATETYLVKANTVTLTGLTVNRSYYWRVKAYNANSTCGAFSRSNRFRTSVATSTEDVAAKASFTVFPNPVTENQAITIETQLPESMRLNIRLLDISGKLLQTAGYDVISGENKLQFVPGNLPKGIYMLHIVGDNLNVIEKLSIQ